MLSFILLIILLIVVFIKYVFNSYYGYWKKRNIKQVNGVMWRFVIGRQALSDIYKDIYESNPNLPYVGTFLGMRPALMLREIEDIQAVLRKDFYSFYDRGFKLNDTDLLADNLLFVGDYQRWRLTRQNLSPFFSTVKLKTVFSVIERCGRDFLNYIEENPQIISENPYNAFYTYTTACVTSAVFGIDEESRNVMVTPFNKIAYKTMKPSLSSNLKFAVTNISMKLFEILNLKAFGEHENLFIDLMKDVMNKRRNDNKKYNDFIDTCLKLENEGVLKDFVTGYETKATVEYLAAQAFVFLLGGIDTTANAINFTLLELSNNPTVLQKVHKEVDQIFKESGTLTFEDIDKMEYTAMVINEAMRKYPPIGSLQRKCCKETILPVGKIKIEKDTLIIIPTYGIHNDEKYFPDPHVFNPERFSPENMSKIVKYSYLPFGEGNRYCIASKLNIILIKTCLFWFLKKYTLKEQSYTPQQFEPSFFGLHDTKIHYEIVSRCLL